MTPYSFDPTRQRDHRERIFSMIHSSVRVGVEWGFGRVKTTFRSLNFEETMRALWNYPERKCLVALLLTNCLVCADSGIHESYFGVAPPTLTQYLAYLSGLHQ